MDKNLAYFGGLLHFLAFYCKISTDDGYYGYTDNGRINFFYFLINMGRVELKHEDLSYILRGIFYETHNKLGRYRNEKQYCDYIEELLKSKKLKYHRELYLDVAFLGEKPRRNRIDFVIEDKIIIEVKVVPAFSRDDYMQCKRYLVSSGRELCLLVNFGLSACVIKRVLNPNMV